MQGTEQSFALDGVAQPYWIFCLCDCILIGRAKLSSVGVHQLTLILSRILTLFFWRLPRQGGTTSVIVPRFSCLHTHAQ